MIGNKEQENINTVFSPVSDEAQLRLAEIWANTPKWEDFNGTKYEVTPLKWGTLQLVAVEICKNKIESKDITTVIKHMATNIESVVRCITLILLNDKDRIKNEYDQIYDFVMWETNPQNCIKLFETMFDLLQTNFYSTSITFLEIYQSLATGRKLTVEEAEQFRAGQQ